MHFMNWGPPVTLLQFCNIYERAEMRDRWRTTNNGITLKPWKDGSKYQLDVILVSFEILIR